MTIDIAGWTLIHFLWQGALIAAITAIILELLSFRSARVRYVVSCAGLLAMLAAPVLTLTIIRPSSSSAIGFAAIERVGVRSGLASDALPPSAVERSRDRRLPVLPISAADALSSIVALWGLGVTILLVRMAGGWWRVQRLHGLALRSAPSRWQEVCARLAARMGIRRVIQVVESTLVDAPTLMAACALSLCCQPRPWRG